MKQRAIALIPLRGGSKSIPDKNIKPIAGKPLCFWVIDAAVSSNRIDQVYVSTDSEKISDLVRQGFKDVKIVVRPPELATDEASTESVMLHFVDQVDSDILVTIQATSPLLQSRDLDTALDYFIDNKCDSLLTAVRSKRFYWTDTCKPINYDPSHRPRRQDFAGTYMENGAFYITRTALLLAEKCRLGGKIGIYEMDTVTATEIDEPEDWNTVESLLKERTAK